VPAPGSNLPDFRQVQLDFAAHIRNPETSERPAGIESRRMQIYIDLFYNNIENFLSNNFPIAKEVIAGERWDKLAREYVHKHVAHSPYFLEIPEEFLKFLDNRGDNSDLPAFFRELCHYEWVELALDVSEVEISDSEIDPNGDFLTGMPVVSPLAWSLGYQYPVHQIGVQHRPPESSGQVAYYYVVYRNRKDRVGFVESNVVTARMLELLVEANVDSGAEVLDIIARELAGLSPKQVKQGGLETLEKFRQLDIILGTRI